MKCPYCNSDVKIVNSSYIYNSNKDCGNFYVCVNFPQCNSYVGCHKGTNKPLGTLANYRLRNLRTIAHKYFDSLWRKGKFSGNRRFAYRCLAHYLGINKEECHIGMFNEEMCKRVINICREWGKTLK